MIDFKPDDIRFTPDKQADVAVLEEPRDANEAYKRAGEAWDMSVDLEVPLSDIENNYNYIKDLEVVDPATSGMGTGEPQEYPLAKTLFVRPVLAATEAAIPGARRGLLSLTDAKMGVAEFTAPGGLADQIENAPWYKKLPEFGGWAAEKYMEYKTLGWLFKATGLSKAFAAVGTKIASKVAGKELAVMGGKQALLKYGGWNTFRIRVLTSLAKTAPENMAFLAAWNASEAARRGEDITDAAGRGALWGLGLSTAIPLLREGAKAGISTKTFEKAAVKLEAKYPRLADFLKGKPEQEFIDATLETLKDEGTAAGQIVPEDVTFTKLPETSKNIIKALARRYKAAWQKALQRDTAAADYWAAGRAAQKAARAEAKVAEKAKPPTKAAIVKPKAPAKPKTPAEAPPVAPEVELPAKVAGMGYLLDDGTILKDMGAASHINLARKIPAGKTVVDAGFLDSKGNYLMRDDVIKKGKTYAFVEPDGSVVQAKIVEDDIEPEMLMDGITIEIPAGKFNIEREQLLKPVEEQFKAMLEQWEIAKSTDKRFGTDYAGPKPVLKIEPIPVAPEAKAEVKPVPKEELPSQKIAKTPRPGDREAGFVEIPPITTAGKIEAEHPNIKVVKPQKDIGIAQKWILTSTNQAQNTGNPLIIEAAETMANTGMVMSNETRSQLIADKHIYNQLPKEYRANKGIKFFELMDKYYPPEEIDAAKDIPEELKPVLKHFKLQDEEMRQEIIKQKRRMVKAILQRKSLADLQSIAEAKGIPTTKQGATKVINRTKAELAKDLAPSQIPDDWGRQWSHIQHIFFGQYELQYIDAEGNTHFIGRAQTQTEAYEKLADWKVAREAAGFDDFNKVNLVATPEIHIPFDVLRISRRHFQVLEKQIQEAADIERQQVDDALRGVISKRESKQKWWGALMHRKGAPGYSQDFWRVWTAQSSQFYRWKHLSEMNRKVEPLIEKVRAQNLRGWAGYLEETKDFMWGRKRSDAGRMLDEHLSDVPVVKNYVRPFALERWAGMIKMINYWRHLQTGRFYTINSLQLLQTLWPVVGEKGTYRGIRLYYSKEGQELLRKHKVAGISGKLHEIGMKPARQFERYLPAGASEIRNQGIAFLALYDDAIKRGMSEADAARHGRLRGQLFTQFTYTQSDIPKMMRGPIGGLIFQYKRFTIKNLELVSRLAREGKWGGVARWLAALTSIGGLSVFLKALPIGLVGYLTYKMYKKIEDAAGKEVADVVHHGLPGLVGIDLSGSVTPIDVPYGDNIYEKTGNIVFGPTGTTAVKMISDVQNLKVAKDIGVVPRALKSIVDSSPTVKQFVFLAKAFEKDTTNYDAKQRTLYELETWDLWKKAFGFRPETETIQRMQFEAMMALKTEYDQTLDHTVLALIEGNDEAAVNYVEEWQTNYPEVAISSEALLRRLKERVLARELPITVRGLMDLPKPLRALFVEAKQSGDMNGKRRE